MRTPYYQGEIMAQYKTTNVRASQLMPDDKFKIAGVMYIVLSTSTSYESYVITFQPLKNLDARDFSYRMYVPTHMKFKIYNKK
jgi:hypothetical protein